MTKFKTIPQVRTELLAVATQLNTWGFPAPASRIKKLVKSLHRRPAVRRAVKEHATVTPSLRNKIRVFAEANPDMSYAKIGRRFNVSNGRVSEVVAGKRAA